MQKGVHKRLGRVVAANPDCPRCEGTGRTDHVRNRNGICFLCEAKAWEYSLAHGARDNLVLGVFRVLDQDSEHVEFVGRTLAVPPPVEQSGMLVSPPVQHGVWCKRLRLTKDEARALWKNMQVMGFHE